MSEPQRLGKILPETMQSIRERMESNKTETMSPTGAGHQAGVLGAIGGFMSGKKPSQQKRVAVLG